MIAILRVFYGLFMAIVGYGIDGMYDIVEGYEQEQRRKGR